MFQRLGYVTMTMIVGMIQMKQTAVRSLDIAILTFFSILVCVPRRYLLELFKDLSFEYFELATSP